jgi:hypothetical protein
MSLQNAERLQELCFQRGTEVLGTGFGTVETIISKIFQSIPVERFSDMASPGGVEPPLPP